MIAEIKIHVDVSGGLQNKLQLGIGLIAEIRILVDVSGGLQNKPEIKLLQQGT